MEESAQSKLKGVIRPTYYVVLVRDAAEADRPESWHVVYVSNGTESRLQIEQAMMQSPWLPNPATCQIVTRTKAQRRYSAAWVVWEDRQRA